MSKLKHYYKVDDKKKPIPGSNVSRTKKPPGKYKRIELLCCEDQDIPCICNFRYWVRLDANNEPVPGSLIKRELKPLGGNYQEVSWVDVCCLLDISLFLAEVDGPTGTILDESGEGILNAELTTTITESEEFQVQAISSIEYFVNGVSVGSVSGDDLNTPGYPFDYAFTLPGSSNFTFTYYSVIHFGGNISYQTDPQSFTLQFNSAPTFSGNLDIVNMIMSEETQAQVAGWVADNNGAGTLTVTYDDVPDFGTLEEFDYAGVKAFRIFLEPETGDAGVYPITITADDGINPPVVKVITLTVDDLGTWVPMEYPYTQAEPLVLTYGSSPGLLNYGKVGFSLSGASRVVSVSSTPLMMNSFGAGNGSLAVSVIPGFAANRTGEGILCVTYYNSDTQTAEDHFFLRVLVNPA